MKVLLVSNASYPSVLVGNESVYPEEFVAPFIYTFCGEHTMHNYYFKVFDIYLQPKYTSDGLMDMGYPYIVVSDEVYQQYVTDPICDLQIVTDLPHVDIISIKRIDGDFPHDSSIDELLSRYLESCNLVNRHQQFTLHFTCNSLPMANYITFEIMDIRYKETFGVEDLNLSADLRNHLRPLGLSATVLNFQFTEGFHRRDAGLVAGQEVKIDFLLEPVLDPLPLQKRLSGLEHTTNHIFQEKGLVLDGNATKLTKEEIRKKRLSSLG